MGLDLGRREILVGLSAGGGKGKFDQWTLAFR